MVLNSYICVWSIDRNSAPTEPGVVLLGTKLGGRYGDCLGETHRLQGEPELITRDFQPNPRRGGVGSRLKPWESFAENVQSLAA